MSQDQCRFEIVDSEGKRLSCHLQGGDSEDLAIVIGRSRDAGLMVSDETVSRQHAAVRADAEGRIFIRDLESRSGSSVNWMILDKDEEIRLRNGDRLGLGSAELMVAMPDGDGPEDPVEATLSKQ